MPVASMLMGSLGGSGGGSGGGGGIGQSTANMAGGLLSGVVGFFQRRKAKRELAKLQRPNYEIPNEVMQNQKMAQQAAQEGLPSQQYNQAMQNVQRQQNRALSAAGSRRGALMALPGINQQANDQLMNLDVKDAQARMSNQQQLYGVNSQVGQYRDKAFNINRMQPYTEDKNYYNNLLASGNQNLLAGADKFIAGGAGLLGGSSSASSSKKMTTSDTQSDPTYYNGYNANSTYSDFS